MYRKVVTILSHPQLLRTKSAALPAFASWSESDQSAIQDLKDTFTVLEGYGLAAPQIGIPKRIIAINMSALGVGDGHVVMINPELELSGETQRNEEACFSVPHISAQVNRSQRCKVSYISEDGSPASLELEGFPAACLQHEVDHLDGLTYLNRVNSAWRGILLNKIRKTEKKKIAAKKAAQQEFDREHRELMGLEPKKTGHSRKRKPKPRKKRPSRSKKRK